MIKKLLFALFIILIASCSSNDDNSNDDGIIGKWVIYKRFENNIEVELDECEGYTYTHYKSDNFVIGGFIENITYPENCPQIVFDFGSKWTSLGNNQYLFSHVNSDYEFTQTIYREGETLVIIGDIFGNNTSIKNIYQRIN